MIPPIDRRQLSIFFFDLVNAAGLSERLDPEDLRDVLRTLLDGCETSVLRNGGHVVQRLGDALLIYFGYPLVLEDDARRAVQAGLESLREVRKRAEILLPKLGTLVQARVGIHTGPVVMEDVGTEDRPLVLAIGETPNKAARVQAAAKPDTIAVSDATYRLTRGYFTFTDRGLEPLKGFTEPTQLYTVEEETGVRSRLDAADANNLTPFVDRYEPLAFLKERWEGAKQGAPRSCSSPGTPESANRGSCMCSASRWRRMAGSSSRVSARRSTRARRSGRSSTCSVGGSPSTGAGISSSISMPCGASSRASGWRHPKRSRSWPRCSGCRRRRS